MTEKYKFPKKTVKDVSVHNKRILLRADYNVPLDDSGKIDSDYRITQSIPTLEYLLSRGASVVVISHLGRPDGSPNKDLSLSRIANNLKSLLPDYKVNF